MKGEEEEAHRGESASLADTGISQAEHQESAVPAGPEGRRTIQKKSGTYVESGLDSPRLARLQFDLDEGFEFYLRTADFGIHRVDVDLCDLCASYVSRVRDLEACSDTES